MVRSLLIFSLLCVASVKAPGQGPLCKVHRDAYGRIVTVCDIYATTGIVPGMASTHNQATYLGSQYLSYPTWQNGVIRTGTPSRDLYCELAYDLINDKVMCRFNGDPKINYPVLNAFVINGLEFVRQIDNVQGTDYQLYAIALYKGPTKLLKSLSNRLIVYASSNGYEKDDEFNGVYHTTIKYHIRKGNDRPQLIELTRKSVVRVLHEQAKRVTAVLPAGKLTVANVVRALTLYDSLMTGPRLSKPTPDL